MVIIQKEEICTGRQPIHIRYLLVTSNMKDTLITGHCWKETVNESWNWYYDAWSRPNWAENLGHFCVNKLHPHIEVVFCLSVNSSIYSFLYQSLCFDSVLISLSNRAFSSKPRARALGAARCFLLTGWQRPRSGFKENSFFRKIESKWKLFFQLWERILLILYHTKWWLRQTFST